LFWLEFIFLGQVSQLESEVEARKKESKALLEDNSRWKDRAQQILEKYNRIDPVEHENLKTKVATLTAEIERLQSQLSNFQSDVGTRVVEKEAEIKSLQSEISALKQQHIQALEQKEIELAGLRDPETNDQIVSCLIFFGFFNFELRLLLLKISKHPKLKIEK
jgi:outer membrane murein-binding lipoprotein Lpp